MNPEKANNFNLLRFTFASLVIVGHMPNIRDGNRSHELLTQIFGTISFGELAVDLFFVLSGFLIVKSWLDNPDVRSFLVSRVLRIYPGFVIAALISAFVIAPLFAAPTYFSDFNWAQFFGTLARLGFRGLPEVFPGTHQASVNGAVWTIPYEFKCYLLVLVLGVVGLAGRRWVWLSVFGLSVSGYVANATGLLHVPFDFYIRFLMAFSAGGCFYVCRRWLPWRTGLAAAAAMLAAAFMFVMPLAEPALVSFGAYAVLWYAHRGTALLGFNRFPDISYGVYLYAWPINKIVLWYWPDMNAALGIFLVFALAIGAGTLSWYGVERPFMALKKRLRRQRTSEALIATGA